MMKKTIALGVSLALSLSLLSGCGSEKPAADAGEMNLFTWDNLFPQEVLDDFTKETGIKVNYSTFDSDETMLAKLEAAKGGEYDVVLADDYIIELAIKEDLVRPLDREKLPNFKNINPAYQGQYYDPEDAYTVPYGAGVQTIVYNPAKVSVDIRGFDDLLDPSLKDSIGISNQFRVTNGMALIANGDDLNSNDIPTIERAGEKLMKLAPNVRLIKDDNLQDDIVSGEISAAIMYTSQVTQACIADPSLKVVYPEEGVGFGVMAQFVPVNASHADEAHQFIDYILRPEVSKKCFESVGYYCTNLAADELIDDEYKPFLTLPKDFNIEEMAIMQNISNEAIEAHSRLWTEFRAACGQ